MPSVDFTKDELLGELQVMMDERMDARFVQERQYTRKMVRGVVREEATAAVNDGIMSFVENNFQPAIESLQEQIGELKVQWTKR